MKIFKAIGAGIGITVSFFYLGCGSVQIAEASHSSASSTLTIATKQLPSAIIGTPYIAALDATGGTPGYTWSVAGGQLPAGVSLTPSTGVISGTPTASGNFSVSLAVADSSSPALAKTSTFTVAVAPPALKISISSLASATVGTPYSQTLQTSGGTAPYSWFITSGALPAGLSLASSTGVISGTPTLSGTVKFTATVRDSGKPAQSYSTAMSITVAALPLKITTLTLPSVTSGAAYSQTLKASGGTPAYTWSIASGSLPSGLTLTSTGTISGTPTISGTASFTAAVADHGTPVQTTSAAFTITVGNTPLTIATPALASATAGSAYSQSLKALGGSAPYTWSILSGSLPAGTTLTPSTGVISGVPTISGTSTFTAKVTDSSNPAQSSSVSAKIVVAAPPLTVSATTLPSVTVGSAYSQTLHANGGTAPYSWSLTSGSLPAGLTFASSGTIAGTPTTYGTFSFTATVTDSSNPVQTASASNGVTINATPLSVVPPTLPAVRVGTPYSKTLVASGGVGPYVWKIASGSLPQGLSLASTAGTISGVPTTSGVSNFTAMVTDSGSPAQSAPAAAAIVVSPTLLAITSSALTSTTIGASYSQNLTATGGSAPYTWAITLGALPKGMVLSSSTGIISGTPTVAGDATFTATVTDSSNPAQVTSATNTISVTPTLAPPAITTPLVLSITTGSLPSLTLGTSYSQTLQASGGTSPYIWTLAAGQLPSGLSLSSSGTISGVPTSSSAATFTVTVTDSGSPAQSQSANLTIASAASPLTITSSSLLSGTSGTSYSQALSASGGIPAYTWSITSGSLPSGLTLAATTGVISGTPTASGTSTFGVSVHDNGSPVQTQTTTTSIAVAAATQQPTGPGTTWFVRPDGGTRYSGNTTNGQCDGQADGPYPGTGTNQHCAFNSFQYLYLSGAYGSSTWVISGGDTVVVRGCAALPGEVNSDAPHCRIGWETPNGSALCNGVDASWGCSPPPIPSGTSNAHTRILGGCAYDKTCNPVVGYPYTANNLAQLFGGFGTDAVLYLTGSSYVDIAGLEITEHNGTCSQVGAPNYPAGCSSSTPKSDYARYGILPDQTTSNITLQDLYIHGLTSIGLGGPIGGPFTLTRVIIAFNAFAGWNFDGPSHTANGAGSSVTQSYVTMIGNGCSEEYPIVHTQFPAKGCWDSNSGGFGDSWSGQDTNLDSFTCDHCVVAYNTKDGAIGPHTRLKNLSLTNSVWIDNMGQQGKWGMQPGSTTLIENNLVLGNCMRMSQALPGAAQNFSQSTGLGGSYLTNYCRAAGNMWDYFTDANSTVLYANNTFVGYNPTFLELGCGTAGTCVNAYTFKNNLSLGYTTTTNYFPNSGQAPGLYYFDDTINIASSNNIEYGIRNGDTCGVNGNLCSDPLLVNEPAQGTIPAQSMLDNFNFHPSTGSPSIGAGTAVPGLVTDYYGTARPTAPTIGAVEP